MEDKSEVFSLLQKQETQLVCPTETSFASVMTTIQGTNGIITGTGTTGCTIDGDTTDGGFGIMIGCLIAMLFLGAHLLDRKLNRELDQELQRIQDQDNQE